MVLLAANVFGTISSQGQSVPSSEDNIINILGIDPTAYPKIKVNIFVDELCAATGDLVKDDFTVEEDGTRVAIDNFYFTGRASGQKLDLAVVFDETDTMADEIRAMKSNVDDLTNKIKASDIDARYSLVSFENEVMPKIEWTADPEVFKREVNQLRAYGGFYKRPEDSLGGVAKALSFGFRPDAQKIIIVITDEPSMQRGDGWSNSTYHQDDVQQELLDAGVMLVAVSPDFRSRSIPSNIPRSDLPLYADMRELAQNSGGLWINIYSADFSVILDQLEDIITGTYVIEYTSPATTTIGSRTVSVSVNAPDCVEGDASSTYMAPASPTVPNRPPIIFSLDSDKASPQELGSIITWTVETGDPDGDQELYRFFLNDEPMTDWTTEKTWTWEAKDSGSYRIEAHVRDGKHAGPNGLDDRRSANFEISRPNSPPTITTFMADKTGPQEAGSVITWTVEAEDPDGDMVLYRFLLDDEPMTDWTTNKTWTWTAPEEAGSYRIETHVRDGKHAGPKVMDDLRSEKFEIIETVLFERLEGIQEANPLTRELGIPSDMIMSVDFTPDGRTLASGGLDDAVKLWDVASGQEIRTLEGHRSGVTSVMFSPDGLTLASGGLDNAVKLWDVASGQEIRTLEGHSDGIKSVGFSPDGRTLASGGYDSTVKLWDVASGQEIRTLASHSDDVESVVFSPDGRTLASGSSDSTVKLWDVATGQEILTLEGHSNDVSSVVFSPNGRTLASGGYDSTVKLWDVTTGQMIRTMEVSSWVFSVAFSPDGRTLASGSLDHMVKLWDVPSGIEIMSLKGHSSIVESVAFSPDGHTVASGSLDRTVKLWNAATGAEIQTMGSPSSVFSVAFSPDGLILASGSDNHMVKLWDVSSGTEIMSLKGHSNDVRSVAFSPDGRTLASGSRDSTVKLWDVTTGQMIRTMQVSSSVFSVAFSPDGFTLASGGNLDGTLTLWDVASGQKTQTMNGNLNEVHSVAFSPDGRTLASGSVDRMVKLWDVATGQEIRTLEGHSSWVSSVAISPDGRTLASGSLDKTVKLWDVASGQEIRTLKGHSNGIESIVFSPDGRSLASGSDYDKVRLWDVSSGQEIRVFNHSSVYGIAFSPDGRTLASGSFDGTIRLWRVT
jgi:WD40 repeat protein